MTMKTKKKTETGSRNAIVMAMEEARRGGSSSFTVTPAPPPKERVRLARNEVTVQKPGGPVTYVVSTHQRDEDDAYETVTFDGGTEIHIAGPDATPELAAERHRKVLAAVQRPGFSMTTEV